MRRAIVLLLSFVWATFAFAWGEKGHLMINEAATLATPNELPPFFHRAYARLIYLGPEPDRWYTGGFESIRAANFPEHFLNYEYIANLELPADRYRFIDLLYTSGTLRRHGIENATTGFAPWRIAELTDELTVEWNLWRKSVAGAERQQIEDNIIHVAGILGHYVGDVANPQHTTIHYNGWVGSTNPEHFRNDCDTHVRFENDFVNRAIDLDAVRQHMRPPRLHTDYFATAMEHIRESNALVLPLYRLDRDGAFDKGLGSAEGREFAAERLGAGASMLRDLWWSAYRNSEKPLADWHTR
ncbi:MAG: hypothetical protein ACXVH7_05315 [Thermoanaerobaculia bacterium]